MKLPYLKSTAIALILTLQSVSQAQVINRNEIRRVGLVISTLDAKIEIDSIDVNMVKTDWVQIF